MSRADFGADPHAGTALLPVDTLHTLTVMRDAMNPRVARITFNRPDRLNAIGLDTPSEIRRAVDAANACDGVNVIVLQGAGAAFCAGYDIREFTAPGVDHACQQEGIPWDPMVDYRTMRQYTASA